MSFCLFFSEINHSPFPLFFSFFNLFHNSAHSSFFSEEVLITPSTTNELIANQKTTQTNFNQLNDVTLTQLLF